MFVNICNNRYIYKVYKGEPSFTQSEIILEKRKKFLIYNIKGTVVVISCDPQFKGKVMLDSHQ